MSLAGAVWYKDQPSYFIINKDTEPIMTQTHPKDILAKLTDDLASTQPYYYREIDMDKMKMGELVKDHDDNKDGTFNPSERGYTKLNALKRYFSILALFWSCHTG